MTALEWQTFEHLPTRNRQVQHTGFGVGGNGWQLLDWLHGRGYEQTVRDHDTDAILLVTNVRADAQLHVGFWLVEDDTPGTEPEVWPIPPAVHDAKYRRAL
jgi:hypothetical protein